MDEPAAMTEEEKERARIEMDTKIDSLIKGSPRIDRENVDTVPHVQFGEIASSVRVFNLTVEDIRMIVSPRRNSPANRQKSINDPDSILEDYIIQINGFLNFINARLNKTLLAFRAPSLPANEVEFINRQYKVLKYYIYGSVIEYLRGGKIKPIDDAELKKLLPAIVTFFEKYEANMFKPSAGGKRRNKRSIRQRKSSRSTRRR